ncbi:MAG: hypothetical protein L0G70_05960 [Rubrobacter sp.]|nr:hypothetical protein [Rubrobacter sp.]
MRLSRIYPNRIAKLLAILIFALALAGCSGGEEQGGSGDSSGSSGASSAPDTTSSAGANTTESTMGAASTEGTSMQGTAASGGNMSTALEGLEAAQSEAESWNDDAELYAIAAQPQGEQLSVNAQGESGGGWIYSFISESASETLSLPYVDGEVQDAQGQSFPEQQLERISEDTLPTEDLIDSSQAISQAQEIQSYLEENPDAGASAGVDSGTTDEPEWIFSVPQDGLQERVPAVE